jgi:methylmalonyl-CoA/ethylmalonyl-CoA epimerase
MKVENIGSAVRELEKSNALFSLLFGQPPYKEEVVESESVRTSFFRAGESKIELLEATDESSAIFKYLEKRGEGIHHIAFEVNDIHAEMERMRASGFRVLNAEPKLGADNKWVCFLHPKDTNGVLVELCMERKA